ncbi:MAG: MarR family transcriptional regulator [Microbacterium ginsengisoli]|jgi:DNA-binding MarR family transcriptional regulator|uniref:MarR family winged helix-turn-helix transcriptional regulator n=1 Tax=Microbacterium TaxID=33882 RepID=UPI00070028A0|nr:MULTISPECIES: MarR family transcriptional regulator [unclassified Microbacterium]KQR90693.1 transcriptional regulator [Microbacterium sp. Leaf351]KQR96891.1 transcriptional regulator [Microbacterium sp. Leaf347]MBN9198031.1 MarR family transcriptional regulator [Microbacterium ginsengisoli]OJU78565.1 MAG: MarR family transcriptional regulator [Microbacterium sp. 71-23]
MDAAPDRVAQIQADWRRERPDLDPSPQGVIGRLHRLALALTAELVPVYAAHSLTEAEFDLLASLRRIGAPYELPAGELAAHTMVTTGGLTKRVDRLVQRGLVARTGSATDARRRLVRLTPAGVALINAAFTDHMHNERRLVQLLSDTDAAALESALTHWLAALGGDDPTTPGALPAR